MNQITRPDSFGLRTEPTTLVLQRLLPGPIERVWSYITDSELRRKWLASGEMVMQPGAPFEFVWRNDDLSAGPSQRPEGFPEEHRMACSVKSFDPPRKLVIGWGETGEVTFELEPRDGQVLLTLTHRRIADHSMLLNVSAGWHMHLAVLMAALSGQEAAPFWPGWQRLKAEYAERFPE